jgi:hypothetical protein
MRGDKRHLSDEQLVLAADNELGRMDRKARAHLETCMQCRTRAAQFEATIADLARTQRASPELPSVAGPRALLRARLAEESASKPSLISRFRISAPLAAGALGVAVVLSVAAAGLLEFGHSHAPNKYSPMLSSDRGVLPNRDYTPGASRPASLQEICRLAHEEVVKEVSPSERQKVFEEYGIPSTQADQYEVDYLITPGLGGEDNIRNLWPEPYNSPTWNAHVKDVLEERLHEMVCSNQLDLSVAQRAIATNWIAAYQKYVANLQSKADGAKEL